MRRVILPAFAAIALVVSSAAVSDAAATTTITGGCTLSGVGFVSMSARYLNTTGNPSRGSLDYVHISAPNPLDESAFHPDLYQAYQPNGAIISEGNIPLTDTVGGSYRYWVDLFPNVVNISQVDIWVWSSPSTSCHDVLHAKN